MEIGYPDVSRQPLLGRRNLLNLLLLLAVPLPGVGAAYWLFHRFEPGAIPPDPGWSGLDSADAVAAFLLHHPIAAVNVGFFANVCLLFWLISLAQRSTWLIDPYWTLIPLFIAAFYAAHPLADPDPARAGIGLFVLGVWSLRLTHNYFRRERWRFGFREDWRFAEKRRQSRHFAWTQFAYVYLAQQVMLVGLTLPYWAIHFRRAAFGGWDGVLALLALLGIGIAHAADTQLDAFMRANRQRAARGEPRLRVLDTGVWRYSRHPNYFGEQLFWWAVAGWGFVVGEPWVVVGTAINSAVLAVVTVTAERRMLDVPERRAAYADYRRRTSVLVPWFPGPAAPVGARKPGQ
jgi:steroid 5-alpha reductase family enzyme